MLTVISGNLGTGKTLFLTMIGYYSDKAVVSNFKTNFPNKKSIEFDVNKFMRCEYENCIILMDEAYIYLESRLSGSEKNKLMSYILFQSRKKTVDLYLTVQLRSTIDKRYRELTDVYMLADLTDLTYNYLIKTRGNKYFGLIKLLKRKVIPLYAMYDTNEVILPDENALLNQTLSGKEKMNETTIIGDKIMEEFPKTQLTRDFVDLYFLKNELPKFLKGYTYTYIRNTLKEKARVKREESKKAKAIKDKEKKKQAKKKKANRKKEVAYIN